MKRHLTPEESDESRSKSRRILDSRNREEEEDPGGFLDLNATPRGFDLNAPVDEEENSHGQSGWLPAQDEFEGKGDIIELQGLVVEEVAQHEAPAKVEIDPGASKSEDSASSAVPSDTAGDFNARETEEARINSKEEPDGPELQPATESAPKLSVLAASILKRTLEPDSNLGIDDDLDILRAVWRAQQQKDLETLDTLVSQACEELSKIPSNPSRYHYLSCFYISKKLPEAFGLPKAFQVLVGILRNAAIGQPTGKRQMILPVLASKLLLRAFASEPDWPLELVQVYLEDATMSRSWIEHDGCKEFVANILTAFPDVDVELSANSEEAISGRASDSQGGTGELLQGQAVKGDAALFLSQGAMPTKNRYPSEEIRARVRTEFLRGLNQLLGSASTKENPRQLLKLLMQGAGYEEVRVVASSMLEGYLNNPVHLRAARALLDRILQHTRGSSDNDLNTVANLLALRITSMQPPGQTKSLHGNIFGDMVTQLVKRRPEFTTLALKTFVTAEVNNRNPHNLKSIVMVLKAMEESPPPEYELALILQELAANDDYRLQLRDLVRRMMKQVGTEIDVHALCHGLMQPWPAMGEQHEILKEAWLKQLVDLSCQLLLHAAAPFALDENVFSAVISSSSSLSFGASNASLKEKLLQVEKFSQDTASFQVDAVAWCTDVLAVYLPSMDESQFTHIVRQLLFLESSEAYFATNENVSEVDLVSFRLLSSCLPAPEEMLARLILMAISDYPVSQGEALKIIERLVWRAASLKKYMDGALTAASLQLPAAIFKLASFNLPGVIQSSIYQAQLVVKDMYWRACLVVLIIAAYNPSTIGWFVWENLPTIRCLMEALLTCTRTFLPIGVDKVRMSEVRKLEVEAEQRDSKAEEAISAFLDVTEKRRNDPISTDSENRGIPMLSPGSISTGQSGEWKGKVMFLNQTGPIRRPPKSAVDELDRVDATYRLGHLLRESRSPDFFAEITKQQTLPEAWPWLRRILVQAPDVITFLPPVWQCEMLFMHEGQHSFIRKLSLDVGKLLLCLRQVMVSLLQTNEAEIESVVGFLAHKLVANSGGVRVQARRCFSCLFDGPPSSASDFNTSMPSSPQDSKRGDPPGVSPITVPPPVKGGVAQVSSDNVLGSSKKGLVVSTINSQGPNMNTSVQIPSSNSSSLSGGNSRVSPGVNHPSVTKDVEQDRAGSCTQASIARDDCKWLENVEKWPTASRVMRVLAPAIQRAVQQENSIPVVVAYIEFLKKWLSRTSLACCLATFIVHREMVASSLLLGSSSSLVPHKDAFDTRHVSRAVTVDLVIDSICRALESGTVSDLTELALVQSPIVTLVLPRIPPGTKELTLVRVEVHKVVVDATLEVLSLLGQEDTEDKIVKPGFEKLLNLLFPSFDNLEQTWRRDDDILGGWLEEGSGKRPLLSEAQAKSFARSKNTRLVKAGLSFLSLESKLELCESFGLSSKGATALLTDLNEQKDMRLEILLGSGSFTRHRLKKLSRCVRTIVKAENKGDGNLLRILEHLTISGSVGQPSLPPLPTSCQGQLDSSLLEPSAVAFPLGPTSTLLEEAMDYVMECLAEKGNGEKFKDWQKFWVTPGYYVQLRKYLQTMMISGWEEKMNRCVMKVYSFLEKAESDNLANVRFLSFGLPIIALLSQYASVSLSSNFNRVVSTPKSATLYLSSKEWSRTDLNLFELGVQTSTTADSKMSGIFVSASVLFRNLEQKMVDLCSRSSADSGKEFSSIPGIVHLAAVKLKESAEGTMDTSGLEKLITNQSITSKMLENASVNRIEALLRIFLRQKLVSVWDAFSGLNDSSGPGSLSIRLVSKTVVSVLRKWWSRDGVGAEALKAKSSPTPVRDQVEYSGRYGLTMEILSFLDPEFQTEGLFSSILDLSRLQLRSRILPTSCTVPVALSCVLHQTSWNTLSKVFYLLLGTELNSGTSKSHRPSSLENGNYGRISEVASSSFHGQEAVMEFITLCVQHPRSKLVCRQGEKSASSKLAWSWVDPSAARVLTSHAILACVAAKSGRDTETGSATSSNLWIQQYVGGLEQRTLCPHKRCLKVLLLAASQGSHITGAIVQQLTSYEGLRDDFTTAITKTSATSTPRSVAQGFLQGLYLAFPVSVKAAMHFSDNKLLLIEERKGLSDIHSIQGQTCSLNGVIHSALRSMCTGNEKESNAAYGFCQEFAREHPLLVMPHLLTLRLLLKEVLPLLRQGEPQQRSSVVRAFMGGLGLLDALRPHVILNSNSIYTSSVISSPQHRLSSHRTEGCFSHLKTSDCVHPKNDLETILDLYFQILENLDIQDRSLLAKLVARFSDFLCHCVAAGGRSREYVAAHRMPILETTAQTYAKSKLKKIGFLLSLLDKPEVALAEEMAPPASVISQPWNCASHPQPTSSSIVLDDILKVRTQLQQCIELYTGESRKEQGLSIYSRGKPIQVSPTVGSSLEEGNLSATLNDLERGSARMPAILTVFEDSLIQLTMVKDSVVRECIYNLLERSLLHCPSEQSASNVVQGLLQQLRSSDVVRAKSAARNAARFFHFSPELQESILVEMLQLGIVASDDLEQLLQGLITVADLREDEVPMLCLVGESNVLLESQYALEVLSNLPTSRHHISAFAPGCSNDADRGDMAVSHSVVLRVLVTLAKFSTTSRNSSTPLFSEQRVYTGQPKVSRKRYDLRAVWKLACPK